MVQMVMVVVLNEEDVFGYLYLVAVGALAQRASQQQRHAFTHWTTSG
jgi:hypothetical protein